MRRLGLCVCVAAILFAAPVTAREKSGSMLDGLYIGAGLSYLTFVGSGMDSYDDDMGFEIKIGKVFESIAVEGNLAHNSGFSSDTLSNGEINWFALDVKWFPNPENEENRLYALAGLGHYWFNYDGTNNEINCLGFNLGGGLEHFFEDRVSLTADIVYRIIKFDEFKDGENSTSIPDISGDAITANVAMNLYF